MHTFTPIRTAAILDALVAAVEYARGSTAPDAWQRAITAAYDYLLQVDTISYDVAAHAIRVESATRSGRAYIANGDCQCEAFTRGAGVCWHRAAARLMRRALELKAIADELYAEAQAAGETWYTRDIALKGASWRIVERQNAAACELARAA